MILAAGLLSAFNLVCTGVLQTTSLSGPKAQSEMPFSETYRIDLKQRRWCGGECATSRSISSFDDTVIVLWDGNMDFAYANRETGELFQSKITALEGRTVTATCRPEPFTGLPVRRF